MCRVNPELIWPHIVAENPNNPTWDMVKPKWRRTYFGPLVDFPGMCPICRKKYDHRSKFPFGEGFERTQDSSSGLFGFKPKQVEDEEVDELAVFLGQTSLSRCHGWQEKQLTTTALPFEDLNVFIAAWAELCEPKTEERYSNEECYWDNIAGLVMAVRKAMVRRPRRNRLQEGDWVVGYMHRSVKQQKEKGKEKENRKEVGEVVGDQKLDSDAVKEEPALRTLQALQASPDSRGSQALQPIQVPKQEIYKRITVSGTKRRVCKMRKCTFETDLGNMKEGDLVAVWVIPEKLLK
ncbi:hypothetical protein FPQ18DRAFT_384297 [Pyronema domesticum]|nr:hypothetical protein FPQ18DRAFT_384297 [Pyronema domesticum]